MVNKKNRNNQRGVSMTELAVSIAIIAILVAGTFGGATLVKAAKIRKVVNEFAANMAAINEFQMKFQYLPGDLPTPSTYNLGSHAGNGNTQVETSATEDLYAWEHLAKAGFITGSYTGAVSGTRYAGLVNAPNSEPYNYGVFAFYAYQTLVYNTAGHALTLGGISAASPNTSGYPAAGVMLAKDAYAIDSKLDDGLASSGMFYTIQDATATGCTDAASTAASANYVLSDATNTTCVLYYWQKKF